MRYSCKDKGSLYIEKLFCCAHVCLCIQRHNHDKSFAFGEKIEYLRKVLKCKQLSTDVMCLKSIAVVFTQ